MPNGYFFEDQAYPERDPFAAAQALGLPPGFGMGDQASYDPAELVNYYLSLGGNYNPYQGYPNKLVPDQLMDLIGPTPDYLLPQVYNIQNPDAGGFDLDAFFGASPQLRGPLAEAYTQAEGDPIKLYNYLQSNEPTVRERVGPEGETVSEEVPGFQDRLRQQTGREDYAQLAEQGYLPIIRAYNQGATPEELDDIALDYYMKGLEDVLAAGAPTSQRAISQFDATRQREGFRPAPGTGQEYPQYEGPGFGGGDAVSSLAGSPQYGGGEQQQVGGRTFAYDAPELGGFFVRPQSTGGDFSGPGRRAAERIRRGEYQGHRRGSSEPRASDRGAGGSRGGGSSREYSGGFSGAVDYINRLFRDRPYRPSNQPFTPGGGMTGRYVPPRR